MSPNECPACGSDRLIKRGYDTKKRARYCCNDCTKSFTAETWDKTKTQPVRLGQAVLAVLSGMSINTAAKKFFVSTSNIMLKLAESERKNAVGS